ncbi:hypothetical protein HG530_000207 [Fusarium avenaceum]|nr:hypothetical protein HG530_000207 [Fusarium avenaceum]
MSILTWFRDFFDSGFWAIITNAFVRLCGDDGTESGQPSNTANTNGGTQVDEIVQVGQPIDDFESVGLDEVVSLSDSSSWVTVDSESMTSSARIHEWMKDVASGSPSTSPTPFSRKKVVTKNKRITKLQKWVQANASSKGLVCDNVRACADQGSSTI